jgi:trehalose synthase
MSESYLRQREKGMYGTLALTPRSVKDYAPIAGQSQIDELVELARPLRGLRVLNLSVTAFGTGVADLLHSSSPLFRDLGLDWQWQIVRADEEANHVNKMMYRALAGSRVEWSDDMTEIWHRHVAMNAGLLKEDFDVVVVHDLQPLAIRSYVEPCATRARWLLHCHIDLFDAQPDVWELLEDHARQYDCWAFEDEAFIGGARPSAPLYVIPPAIDPLGPRNMDLSTRAIADILQRYGIDIERPIVSQVAPISEDCDSLGALEVYRLAKEKVPELQLVMLATSAPGGSQPYAYFQQVLDQASGLADVHMLSHLNNVGNVEINVLQRASATVLQRGLHKGFGIWLSDALWKGTPVIGARQGGIPKQVVNGRTGYLASTNEEFADRLLELLAEPGRASALGAAGRRHVADHFLICRFLSDYLRLLIEVSEV